MEKLYEVRMSSIHNKGVFAACDIKKGQKIIEYVGQKITKKESDIRAEQQYQKGEDGVEGHVYIFELNKRYDIDGNVDWNDAKYINHSCSPNCESINMNGHIWICARKSIKKGDELSYDYGYDHENHKEHPCKCGSKNCIGYIVARKHWKKVRNV